MIWPDGKRELSTCNIDSSIIWKYQTHRRDNIIRNVIMTVSWFIPLVYYVTNGVTLVKIGPYAGLNLCLRAQSFRASKRTSYQTSEIYLDIIQLCSLWNGFRCPQSHTRGLQPLITASLKVHTDENATCLQLTPRVVKTWNTKKHSGNFQNLDQKLMYLQI